MHTGTRLLSRRLSLQACLSFVGLASLILLSGCASVLPATQPSHQRKAVQPRAIISPRADIIIVVDNINEIALHDPTGARFIAARLLVGHAQPGDRIGVVRIPSSDKPSPVKLLDLTTIQNESDRETIKQVLRQGFFGPVDRGPMAYFVPAFQTASQMLLSAHDNNRKYIIVMTDTIAESGDQERCPAAPDQYHRWFCEISGLEADKITVIFYAFTTSHNETELQPTRQYLEQHGGIVLEVG